jgi:hexosaminidase
MTLRALSLLLVAVAATGTLRGQEAPAPAIVPRPASLEVRPGSFTLTPDTVILTDPESNVAARWLAAYLGPATGYRLPVANGTPPARNRVIFRMDGEMAHLGPEGYQLEVTPDGIDVRASGLAGAFYAVQTIRQLLPPAIFRAAYVPGVAWTLPAVRIEDTPRFAWRGAHLDVARHFMPKEFVKKYIDLLALHKLNVFHWHLTDDQGWRIEIKKYPRLTSVGAWRKETLVGHSTDDPAAERYDGLRHGGFYTQDDVREIVEYARARFVTVVPEIEMPGHSVAAIAAYPELGVTGEPTEVATKWGVFDDILDPSDRTIAFMQDVLTEVMALFPNREIHLGGDEAVKTRWKASPEVQAHIKALGLENEEQLQGWFMKQMDAFLAAHGRRLVGWDEILEGGLSPNAVVMSWRGEEGGIAAARAGHDVVMTPTAYSYFDYYQSQDRDREPLAIGGYLPLERVYGYDPVPAGLEPRFATHVLGAQGQLWSEYLPGPKAVEYMAFPRLCALAEVVWTPKARKNDQDFLARLATHLERLAILDVNYRPLDQ